jgi:toxin CptA
VVYPLGRSSFLRGVLLVFWVSGLISVLLWWNVMRQFDWRLLLAGFSVLLACLAARITWKNLPGGQLVWGGDVWRWESPGYQTGESEHTLSIVADFQQRLLLRLENQDGASLWLWVEQNAMPERWLDLRRAVYSPHRSRASLPLHDFLPTEPSGSLHAAVAPSKTMQFQHVSQVKR